MNISAAISQANTFEDIHRIIFNESGRNKAQPQISFWGTRYLVVLGYEGETTIDILAERVMQLTMDKNFEYGDEERYIGKNIVRQINQLYVDDDNVVNNSNLFTIVLVSIRKLWGFFSAFCLKHSDPYLLFRGRWEE